MAFRRKMWRRGPSGPAHRCRFRPRGQGTSDTEICSMILATLVAHASQVGPQSIRFPALHIGG